MFKDGRKDDYDMENLGVRGLGELIMIVVVWVLG